MFKTEIQRSYQIKTQVTSTLNRLVEDERSLPADIRRKAGDYRFIFDDGDMRDADWDYGDCISLSLLMDDAEPGSEIRAFYQNALDAVVRAIFLNPNFLKRRGGDQVTEVLGFDSTTQLVRVRRLCVAFSEEIDLNLVAGNPWDKDFDAEVEALKTAYEAVSDQALLLIPKLDEKILRMALGHESARLVASKKVKLRDLVENWSFPSAVPYEAI